MLSNLVVKRVETLKKMVLAQIGFALENGFSLFEALSFLPESGAKQPLEASLVRMRDLLEEGVEINEVVSSLASSGLPSWFLSILASPLNEREKGVLISNHPELCFIKTRSPAVEYLLFPIIVFLLVFVALSLFVIPQFESIFQETAVPSPPLVKAMFWGSNLVVQWDKLIILIGIILIFLIFKFWENFKLKIETEGRETIYVLRSLSRIDRSFYPRVLSVFAQPSILPKTYQIFNKVFDNLSASKPFPAQQFGQGSLANWAISLGLQGNGAERMFKQIADLIETRVSLSLKRNSIVVENFLLIGTATIIGITAAGTFGCMLAILDHCMK